MAEKIVEDVVIGKGVHLLELGGMYPYDVEKWVENQTCIPIFRRKDVARAILETYKKSNPHA